MWPRRPSCSAGDSPPQAITASRNGPSWRQFSSSSEVGVKTIAVWEQNAGQMIDDVRIAVAGRVPVRFIGGISHDHSGFGVGPALEPAAIMARIEAVYPGRCAA